MDTCVCEQMSLHEEKRAEGQGINAGAIETADGAARIGDERFAEKIKRSVDQDRGGGGLAKFVK